ncbi:MAG: lipid biosynthesis B12-binding/radical SAM protein [Nitrospirota bacterium]
MRVLLISANREMLPDPVTPIGLAYVAAAIKKAGHNVSILDLCFSEAIEGAIKDEIKAYNPDVIGISIRNIDNVSYPNSISYISAIKNVVETCKGSSNAKIVLGGSGFTIMPEMLLNFLNADFGIIGEGEETFPELLEKIRNGNDFKTIFGLIYRKENRIVKNPIKIIKDLNSLSMPDRELLDNTRYLKDGGSGNIQTKRGCYFKCIYCTYPLVEGSDVRLRSPKLVADEFEFLEKEYNLSHVFVVDNVFNYPISHAEEICRELINRRLKIKWSCYANPGFITERLVDLMVKAGCTGIDLGTDAASEKMLKSMGKNFNLYVLKDASRICNNAGLSVCQSLLLGGPGETKDTLKETLENIEALNPKAVVAMTGIRMYPNTTLAKIAEEEGMIPEKDLSLTPYFYIAKDVRDNLVETVEDFSLGLSHWILPGRNIRMTEKIQKMLRKYGALGPLWEYVRGVSKK